MSVPWVPPLKQQHGRGVTDRSVAPGTGQCPFAGHMFCVLTHWRDSFTFDLGFSASQPASRDSNVGIKPACAQSTRCAQRWFHPRGSSRDGTDMALLSWFLSFTSGAQSIAGFKELPALRQHAIISGSMIIASTANCTKYLPNDEDCREAGKITFFIMS